MGVDRLPSGSYRARLMIDGQTYAATFATEAEADEWVLVTRGRVVGERAARRLTVEEYARRWLGEFIDIAAEVDRYRHDVAELIVPALGSCPLVELRPAEVVALLEQVSAEVSPAIGEQVRVTLQELFVDAVDDGLIAGSPVPARVRAQRSGSPRSQRIEVHRAPMRNAAIDVPVCVAVCDRDFDGISTLSGERDDKDRDGDA